jgi:hypothetical protein
MAAINRTAKRKNEFRLSGIFFLLSALLLASQVWFTVSETTIGALTWILIILFLIVSPTPEPVKQPKTTLSRKALQLLWSVAWRLMLLVVVVTLAMIAAVGLWKIIGLQPQLAGAVVLATFGTILIGLSFVPTGRRAME